jgi:hypothetical protein
MFIPDHVFSHLGSRAQQQQKRGGQKLINQLSFFAGFRIRIDLMRVWIQFRFQGFFDDQK